MCYVGHFKPFVVSISVVVYKLLYDTENVNVRVLKLCRPWPCINVMKNDSVHNVTVCRRRRHKRTLYLAVAIGTVYTVTVKVSNFACNHCSRRWNCSVEITHYRSVSFQIINLLAYLGLFIDISNTFRSSRS